MLKKDLTKEIRQIFPESTEVEDFIIWLYANKKQMFKYNYNDCAVSAYFRFKMKRHDIGLNFIVSEQSIHKIIENGKEGVVLKTFTKKETDLYQDVNSKIYFEFIRNRKTSEIYGYEIISAIKKAIEEYIKGK